MLFVVLIESEEASITNQPIYHATRRDTPQVRSTSIRASAMDLECLMITNIILVIQDTTVSVPKLGDMHHISGITRRYDRGGENTIKRPSTDDEKE